VNINGCDRAAGKEPVIPGASLNNDEPIASTLRPERRHFRASHVAESLQNALLSVVIQDSVDLH